MIVLESQGTHFPAEVRGLWYVAHTRSRNEKMLALQLARLQVPYYLPLSQRVTRSAITRRVSRSMVPVFPGYVFFNATTDQRYEALRTNRIVQILDVPNQDQLVAELLQLDALLAHTEDFDIASQLQVGDWARISSGPLLGLEGIITRTNSRWRLHMNVTILGQSANVEIDAHSVEKIDPPSYVK